MQANKHIAHAKHSRSWPPARVHQFNQPCIRPSIHPAKWLTNHSTAAALTCNANNCNIDVRIEIDVWLATNDGNKVVSSRWIFNFPFWNKPAASVAPTFRAHRWPQLLAKQVLDHNRRKRPATRKYNSNTGTEINTEIAIEVQRQLFRWTAVDDKPSTPRNYAPKGVAYAL